MRQIFAKIQILKHFFKNFDILGSEYLRKADIAGE